MKTGKIIFVCAVMFSICTTAAFAVPDDSILSQQLKEADGTSGQDTNSGSGIKTAHIQDGAITDAKISGTISAGKLATYAGIKIVHTGPADGVNTFNSINAALAAAPVPSIIKVMPGTYNESVTISTGNDSIVGISAKGTVINGSVQGGSGFLKDITVNGDINVNTLTMERVRATNSHIVCSYGFLRDVTVDQGTIEIGGNGSVINTTVVAPAGTTGIFARRAAGVSDTPFPVRNVVVAGGDVGLMAVGQVNVTDSSFSGATYGMSVSTPLAYREIDVTVAVSDCTANGGVAGAYLTGRGDPTGPKPLIMSIKNSSIKGNTDGIRTYDFNGKLDVLNSKISGSQTAINNVDTFTPSVNLIYSQFLGTPVAGHAQVKMLYCYDEAINPLANQ